MASNTVMVGNKENSEPSNNGEQQLTSLQKRRLQMRKEWDAYWKFKDLETTGTLVPRAYYLVHRFFDAPATWFRENIVEPLHDKHKKPYYHRRLNRIPDIDQCGVNDPTCAYEANEQYRLDKMIDYFMLFILIGRAERCATYYGPTKQQNCIQELEDMESADLNYFIKYGELGSEADVLDVYMKQKHRLIWERRHPEVMEARQKSYDEYLEKKKQGDFDYSFWKYGLWFLDKKKLDSVYGMYSQKPKIEGDVPLSKDWQYYKKLSQDPNFDKEQGKKSEIPGFIPPI